MNNIKGSQAEEPEIKLPTSARSSKKQGSSRKTSFCFIDNATMALIPTVLTVTKIQAFLASILLISFPYCSVLSLLAHLPTAFLPPLFTLPSGAPVSLHMVFPTPPGLN